jgi:hypothetical protein
MRLVVLPIDDECGSGGRGAAVELNHMPLFRHNTDKPELPASGISVLMLAAGRNIGIGSNFDGGVFAIDMQGAMTFKYIIDVGPLMGMFGRISAFTQFDHPHDISIPALLW